MFCPGCSLHVNDDLKFCRHCGANLRGVHDAMASRPTEEKFDWSKTWWAEMVYPPEELERRRKDLPVSMPQDGIKPAAQMLEAGLIFKELLKFRLRFEALEDRCLLSLSVLAPGFSVTTFALPPNLGLVHDTGADDMAVDASGHVFLGFNNGTVKDGTVPGLSTRASAFALPSTLRKSPRNSTRTM